MVRKIKEGQTEAQLNPSIQDLVSALQEGPRAAIKVYRNLTEKQYQTIKTIMDALEELLPNNVVIAWKTIEAFHDAKRGL